MKNLWEYFQNIYFSKWKSAVRGSFHMKVGDGLTTFALWVQIYGPNIQGASQLETSNLNEVFGLYTMDYITKASIFRQL